MITIYQKRYKTPKKRKIKNPMSQIPIITLKSE